MSAPMEEVGVEHQKIFLLFLLFHVSFKVTSDGLWHFHLSFALSLAVEPSLPVSTTMLCRYRYSNTRPYAFKAKALTNSAIVTACVPGDNNVNIVSS